MGGAFAFGALPKVWACSTKGEKKIFEQTKIGGGVVGVDAVNFQNVKLGFQSTTSASALPARTSAHSLMAMPPRSRVPRHAATSTTDPKTFATSQRRASSKLAKISPERPESRAATSSSSTFSKQRRCSNRELRFTRSRFYSEVAHPLGKDNSQASDDSKAFLFRIWFPSSIVWRYSKNDI